MENHVGLFGARPWGKQALVDTVTLRTQLSLVTFMLGSCKPPAQLRSVGLFIGASVVGDT